MTDFNIGLGFDINDQDAKSEADQFFDAFERGFRTVVNNMAKDFDRLLVSLRRDLTGGSFQQFTRDVRAASRALEGESNAAEALDADIKALEARFRSFRTFATQAGADSGLLAVYEREFQRLTALQRRFESERAEIVRNPAILRARQAEGELIRQAFVAETRAIQSQLRDQNALRVQQFNRERELQNNATRERIAQVNAARSQFVVAQQREGSQRLAETRIAGQRLIQEERATQRRRIEVLRFAFNQVRNLERALGSVFSATGTVVSGAARRVASALSSLGDSFRRSNREMTQGLGPALQRREGLISRSFREQEISVSRSIQRQQATIERFERVAATGALGAATGRSLTGRGLAGLGLGVGAGVGVGSLLTGGFARFSNLERLQKQFEALTGSAEQASALLQEVAAFAKTTPFDLVGVADLAKGFLAIGTAAEDVIPNVKTIADAVALTGGNADNLVRIQRAIGQVVSAGRLQGDELNQLAENLPGLNIRKILADQLTGGNVQALVEMQEAGKLTAEMFVGGLLTGLSTDPRLVGASEDLAKTLGGRVANLRESFEDFGASLIGLIADPLRQAVLISQTALQGLADFVRGDVTGALDVLRTAVGGAAIALGSLLVARAAGQAIQILGLAVRAALTPFGIFAIAVAGIGAALAVLMERSPEVRVAMANLGEAVGEVLAPAMEFAADVLEGFTDFLTTSALPALESFATSMIQRIQPALESFGRFIADTMLPALQRFAEFALDTAIPTIASGLASAFDTARTAAVAFWDFVEPILAPAITGFGALGSAIADVFTGDFTSLLPALAELGRGLGQTFQNLGTLIFNGLRGPVEDALAFLRDAFSADNLRRLAFGFLDLVEEFGFIIGNIATDRRVVTALAALAASAVAIGARFVQGLARGILDNAPDLLDAVRDLFVLVGREALGAIFDSPQTVALAFAGALAAPIVLRTLFGLGAQAGGAFARGLDTGTSRGRAARVAAALGAGRQHGNAYAQGLVSGITSSIRGGVVGAPGFFSGLFGGVEGARRAAARQGETMRRELVSQVQRINRDIVALGGRAVSVGFGGAFVNDQTLKNAQDRLGELRASMSNARAEGLLLRDRMSQVFGAIGFASRGAAQAMRGNFDGAFQNIRASAATLRRVTSDAFGAARAEGIGVGSALGQGVLAGFGAALSGNLAGSSTSGVGQAVGIGGILASALAVSQIPGVGPALAGVTLAVGGLTTVLAANERAAKKAAAEIREYRDALVEAETGAERIGSATDILLQNISDELPRTLDLLNEIGFNARLFAADIVNGADSAALGLQNLEDRFGNIGVDSLTELKDALDELETTEGIILGSTGNAEVDAFIERVEAAGFSVNDLKEIIDVFNDESGDLTAGLAGAAALQELEDRTQGVAQGFRIATGTARIFAAALISQTGAAFDDAINGISGTVFQLRQLNDQRIDQLGGQIERITSRLSDAQVAADSARDRLTNFLTAGSGGAANQAVVAAEGIATAVQEATAGVGDEVIDTARRSLALDDFRREIQNVINEGFSTGVIDKEQTQADLFAALAPLSQALDELRNATTIDPITGEVIPVISQETRDLLGQEITDAITNTDLEATVGAVIDADATVKKLEEDLQTREVELNARLNVTNLDEIMLALSGEAPTVPRQTREDFGPTVPSQIVNIEVNGARAPTQVARATVRELALQGARAAARADSG